MARLREIYLGSAAKGSWNFIAPSLLEAHPVVVDVRLVPPSVYYDIMLVEKALSREPSCRCPWEKDQLVDLLFQISHRFIICYKWKLLISSFLISFLLYNFNNSSQLKTIFLCWVLQREQSRLSLMTPSHLGLSCGCWLTLLPDLPSVKKFKDSLRWSVFQYVVGPVPPCLFLWSLMWCAWLEGSQHITLF